MNCEFMFGLWVESTPVIKFNRELTLNPLGFTLLWFKPSLGHMWESQVLLTDGQWFFSGYSGFRPPSMNDQIDGSEIFLEGP